MRYVNTLSNDDLAKISNEKGEVTLVDSGASSGVAEIARPDSSENDIWQWTIYDAAGQMVETINGDGSHTAYEYDASGRLTDTLVFAETYTPADIAGFKTDAPTTPALVDADAKNAGALVRTFYDRDGNVIGSLSPEGALTEIIYDAAGRKTAETTYSTLIREPLRAIGSFDALRASIPVDGANDVTTRYVYDGKGMLRFTIDGVGHVTEMREIFYLNGSDTGRVVQTIDYDDHDLDVTIAISGDTYTELQSATVATDRTSYAIYNSLDQLIYAIDASGAVAKNTYDSAGRVVKTTQFATLYNGASSLNTGSNWISELDNWSTSRSAGEVAEDRITQTFYSSRNEVIATVDAERYVTTNTYDAAGQLTHQSRYDSALTAEPGAAILNDVNPPAGEAATTQFKYDSYGRVVETIDAENVVTRTTYYATGEKQKVTMAHGSADASVTEYEYDAAGRLERVVYAKGEIEETQESYTYDAFGNVETQTDGNGAVTSFVYDKAGRVLTTSQSPDGGATIYKTGFTYNAFGQVFSAHDANDGVTYSFYDQAGRTTAVVDAGNYVTTTEYNAFGDVASVTRYANKGQVTRPDTSFVRSADDAASTYREGNVDLENGISVGDAVDAFSDGQFARVISYPTGVYEAWSGHHRGEEVKLLDAPPTGGAVPISPGKSYTASVKVRSLTDGTGLRAELMAVVQNADGTTSESVLKSDFHNNPHAQWHTFEFSGNAPDGATSIYFKINPYRDENPPTKENYSFAIGDRFYSIGDPPPQITIQGDNQTSSYIPKDTGLIAELDQTEQARLIKSANAIKQWENQGENAAHYWGGTVEVLDGNNGDALRIVGGKSFSASVKVKAPSSVVAGTGVQLRAAYILADGKHSTPSDVQFIAYTNDLVESGGSINWQTLTLNAIAPDDAVAIYLKLHSYKTVAFDADAPAAQTLDFLIGERTFNIDDGLTAQASDWQVIADPNKDSKTTFEYDNLGRLLQEKVTIKAVENGDDDHHLYKTHGYDTLGNRTATREWSTLTDNVTGATNDADEERNTTYTYDKLNRLVSTSTDAVNYVSDATSGAVVTAEAPTEEFRYDARGNLVRKLDALGNKTTYWFDALNRVTHELSAAGTLTQHFYDNKSNVVETRVYAQKENPNTFSPSLAPPSGGTDYRETHFEYDALNRLTRSWIPSVRAGALDSNGAYVSATLGGDLETHYEYDAMGNVVKTTDPNGGETFAYYDNLNRKTHQIDAGGYATQWEYDDNGNVLRETRYTTKITPPATTSTIPQLVTHADDRITEYSYDSLGRRVSETRLNVKVYGESGGAVVQAATDAAITYTYNASGQVTSKAEANGDVIDYTYDSAGRLYKEQVSSFAYLLDASGDYVYQNWSKDTTTVVSSTTKYEYSALGDLKRLLQIDPDVDQIAPDDERIKEYVYLDGGRLSIERDASDDGSGIEKTFVYDKAGRVLREEYTRTLADGGTVQNAVGYVYDDEGRVIKQGVMTFDGVNSWQFGDNLDYQETVYNAFGDIELQKLNGTTIAENKYDLAGRLTATNASDGVWRYFLHDANGNQTMMASSNGVEDLTLQSRDTIIDWAIAGDDRVIETFTKYNARNLATETVEPDRGLTEDTQNVLVSDKIETTRTYNAFGEVESETNARGAVTSYEYNTMGRQIKRTLPAVEYIDDSDATVTGTPIEEFYYDASGRQLASRDARGNVVTRTEFVSKGGSHELIQRSIAADGGTTDTHFNDLGDVVSVKDQRGRVTNYTYNDVGQTTQIAYANGLLENFTYDELGQRLTRWDNVRGALNVEQTTFDAQGRVIEQIAFGGDTTRFSYVWDTTLSTSGLSDFDGWTKTTEYFGHTDTSGAAFKTATEGTDAFGRQVAKTDMGGNSTSFTFDKLGRLITRTGGGSTITNTYYNTSRLRSVSSSLVTGLGSKYAEYGYDEAGNLTFELLKDINRPVQSLTKSLAYTNASAQYDALGRLIYWEESGDTTNIHEYAGGWGTSNVTPSARLWLKYDANGNIRSKKSIFAAWGDNGHLDDPVWTSSSIKIEHDSDQPYEEYKYRFDSMNRAVESHVSDDWTNVAGGSQAARSRLYIQYDNAGRRERMVNFTADGEWVRESYTYDAADNIGQVHTTVGANANNFDDANKVLRAELEYDKLGRLTSQIDKAENGVTVYHNTRLYDDNGRIESDTAYTKFSDKTVESSTTYNYSETNLSFYALGQVYKTVTEIKENFQTTPSKTQTTTNKYDVWTDGANQTFTENATTENSTTTTTSTSTFNYVNLGGTAMLDNVKVESTVTGNYYVHYSNDFSGQIVQRHETNQSNGEPHEIWYRFGGKEIGYVGNNGSITGTYAASIDKRTTSSNTGGAFRYGSGNGAFFARFAPGIEAINSFTQGSMAGTYTVRNGDTLYSIAGQTYGDSSLWYKIAQANGLSAGARLTPGQSLRMPSGVQNNSYNSETFKPYNPGEAIGDVTSPKPAKNNDCGVIGLVIMAVVAVVVSVFTAGAAAAAMAGGWGAAFGGGVSALAGGALAGGTMTGIAAGAIGGAVGSIASQGVGVAMGMQDDISWNAVATAAIASGVGGAMSSESSLLTGKSGWRAGWQGAALREMSSNALTQSLSMAVGAQDNFDFAGVAVAGIGAPVSATGWGSRFGSIGTGTVSAIAGSATRSALDGSSFGDNFRAAIANVIGQAIGDVLSSGIAAAAKKIDNEPVDKTTGAGRKTAGPVRANGGLFEDEIVYEPIINQDAVARLRSQQNIKIVQSALPDIPGAKGWGVYGGSWRRFSVASDGTRIYDDGAIVPSAQTKRPNIIATAKLTFNLTQWAFNNSDRLKGVATGMVARGGVETTKGFWSLGQNSPATLLLDSLTGGNRVTNHYNGARALLGAGADYVGSRAKSPGMLVGDAGSALGWVNDQVANDSSVIATDLMTKDGGFLSGVGTGYKAEFLGQLAFDALTGGAGKVGVFGDIAQGLSKYDLVFNHATLSSGGLAGFKVVRKGKGVPARLSVEEAAKNLVPFNNGANRVSVMTPSGRMQIDLAGKSHFEKSIQGWIDTPHVKFQPLNTAPNGKTSLGPGVTRPATMDDIRTAEKILNRRNR